MVPEIKLQYLDEERNKFIGQQIAKARKQKHYKAVELAEAIGIGKDQYSKIENGRVTCTIDNLFLLAQYLDLDVQFLLFGTKRDERINPINKKIEMLNYEELVKVEKMLDIFFD